MRAIWSGSLSFGLINIPVKVYSASEPRGINLDMLDKRSLQPIGYSRVIKGTDKTVKYEDIVRGFEYKKGSYVVLDPEDFKRASPKKTGTIDIQSFVDETEIDSKLYEKPYYLEPDSKATKAYALLREALLKSGRVAVATFVLREREHVAVVKPDGNALVLNQLRFAEDIRSSADLKIPGKSDIKEREVDMAIKLIDQLTEEFKPQEYKDTYTADLMEMIKAKSKGKKIKAEPVYEEEPSDNKDDLFEILQASLRSGLRSRPSTNGKARATNGKAPVRKTQARSSARPAGSSTSRNGSAAKSSAAKKTGSAAKKTAGRTTPAGGRTTAAKKTAPAKRATATAKTTRRAGAAR